MPTKNSEGKKTLKLQKLIRLFFKDCKLDKIIKISKETENIF